MKNIAIFTANRAEHGLLEPVKKDLEELGVGVFWAEGRQHADDLVSGMELAAMAARGHLAPKPDFSIVPCDRQEMVGVALYLFYHNLPFAQFHAGDIGSGIHDEVGRWIISRCANIHFCNSPESARNLVRSGEEPWRIQLVGSTAFDDAVIDDSRLPEQDFDLLLVHPDTFSLENTKEDIEKALSLLDKYTIAVGPNEDTNYGVITESLLKYHYQPDAVAFEFRASLPRPQFLSLMKHCKRFITNSSSALYELPFFDFGKYVPIGHRNAERKPLTNIEPGASKRIAQFLKTLESSPALLRKRFTL